MITKNWDLLEKARLSIRGKWGLAIGAFLVLTIIEGGFQYIVKKPDWEISLLGSLLLLAIMGPLSLGKSIFSLAFSRKQEPRFEQIFEGFKDFKRSSITFILYILIVFMFTLLLIIPGIIAGISYSQVFFILADDPDIKPADALDKSKQMMKGYKWKYFGLQMIFLLGVILSFVTLGLALLWFIPWINVTEAHFYEDIKNQPAITVQQV